MAANSKNFLPAYEVINSASMATNITSAVTDVRYLDNLAYALSWTGNPTGTFDLQGSEDYVPGSGSTVLNAGTWFSMPLTDLTNPAGSASQTPIFINQFPFPFMRLVYTASGGTGTLTGYLSGKAI